MGNHKKYWKSELELSSDSNLVDKLEQNEFVEELPMTITGKPQKFIMRDKMIEMLSIKTSND